MPALVRQVHLNEHVARVESALHDALLRAARLGDLFARNQDLTEISLHAVLANALLERSLHLVFVAGVRLNDVPAHLLLSARFEIRRNALFRTLLAGLVVGLVLVF